MLIERMRGRRMPGVRGEGREEKKEGGEKEKSERRERMWWLCG